MPRPADTSSTKLTGLDSRFGAFVAERHPLALSVALEALDTVRRAAESGKASGSIEVRAPAIEALRGPFRRELARRL
jgi:hypothetical protein